MSNSKQTRPADWRDERKRPADWRGEWEDWDRAEREVAWLAYWESQEYQDWPSVWGIPRELDDAAPADFAHPAAAAYFGPLVEAAPSRYRGWLRRLTTLYAREAMDVPEFREAVERGEGFEKAWPVLPYGEFRTVGYFLDGVRHDGLFFECMAELNFRPKRAWEDDGSRLSFLDKLLPGGLPAVVRDATADPDPMIRVMAASVCHERSFGLIDLNARLSALGPVVLPPLLSDPVPQVRAEAALQLAYYAQGEPTGSPSASLIPAITDALAAAAAAGTEYMVPYITPCPLDQNDSESGTWRNRAAFLRALGILPGVGPDCFRALGADALPELIDCLRHVINREPLARAAAATVARLGVVAVETLYALAALRDDSRPDEETRRAAGAAFDALAERLSAGTASIPDTGEGLFLTVWQKRDDRVARLVYADWLDENDQPDCAEYVRLDTTVPINDPTRALRERELAARLTPEAATPARPGWLWLWRWATAPPSPF